MKFILFLLLLSPAICLAQNRVGINTTSPDSELDVRSTSITEAAELNLGNADNTHFLRLFSGRPSLTTPIIYWNHGDTLEISRADVDGGNYEPFLSLDGQTIGVHNTGHSIFIGEGAGSSYNSTNGISIAIGRGALTNSENGYANVAIGDSALHYNESMGLDGNINIAVGVRAMRDNVSGSRNTGVGGHALQHNVSGSNGIAVGFNALYHNLTGSNNTAVGNSALFSNTSGSSNVACGIGVLIANTTGRRNAAFGAEALISNTTGNSNVAIGYRALHENTTMDHLVAVGDSALYHNGIGATGPDEGRRNSAFGSRSLFANERGFDNTAVGHESLKENTAGYGNVALGTSALRNNTGGFANTATGVESIDAIANGTGNTANGYNAMTSHSFGDDNTAVGGWAMEQHTSGFDNTALGNNAMKTNLAGSQNTVVGVAAGFGEGNQNTIIGTQAGGTPPQLSRSGCVYIGYKAGYYGELDDRLFIDNSDTYFPLIYGEFDNDFVKINGELEATETVKGNSATTSGNAVYGESTGQSGKALYGYATGLYGKGAHLISTTNHSSTNALLAQATGGSSAYAAWFTGKVHVDGNLSKASGSFKIDHPLDPENKYLYHSFVESPDMMNIYNGNVVTDANGEALVELPDYFEALNMEFRYQLTVVGQFAQAIISEKISGNKFKIMTDKPGVEVSWQVTGVRNDPYAAANRIQVVVDKEPENKGKFLTPLEYGKTRAEGIGFWDASLEPTEQH